MNSKIETASMTGNGRRSACRRLQKGATLLEAVAFLGIAAIILIGAVALFTTAFSSARSNALTEQVTAIQTAIRNTYGSGAQLESNLASGITGLVNSNALPSTLSVDSSGSVHNDWGGEVTVTWDATNGAAEISYTKVPKAACIAAVSSASGFTLISTSSVAVVSPLPASSGQAISACAGDTNTVNWEFNG